MKKSTQSEFHQPEFFEIDLRSIGGVIKQNWVFIAVVTFCFFLMGVYHVAKEQPIFESTAMIQMVNNNINSLISAKGGGGAFLSSSSSSVSPSVLETILLKSPYVLSGLVRQMGLDIFVSPYYSGFFARKWAQWRDVRSSASVSVFNAPNFFLGKKLKLVVVDKKHYLLLSPAGEKILTGSVGRLEQTQYLKKSLSIFVDRINAKTKTVFTLIKIPARTAAQSLAGALTIQEVGDSMSTPDSGVLSLGYFSLDPANAHHMLKAILSAMLQKDLEDQTTEEVKSLAFLKDELPFARKQFELTEDKLTKFGLKTGVFNPKNFAKMRDAKISRLQFELQKIQVKKLQLLQNFTPLHPFVIAATAQEHGFEKQIQTAKKDLQKLSGTVGQAAILNLQAKLRGGMYGAMVDNAARMKLEEHSKLGTIRMLSDASYPISPQPTRKLLAVFASSILGLLFSLMIVFIRYILSPVIGDPDRVERALSIPVLSILPYSMQQNSAKKEVSALQSKQPFLLSLQNPHDVVIEAMRGLRTALQIALLEARNNVIMITGVSPSIGKSFVSGNLAKIFSDLDKRVLLIDGDLRLGKLFEVFGRSKSPGLSDYLQGKSSLQAMKQIIIPDRLDFISTGVYPEHPSELLSNTKFGDLLSCVESQYDFVIIDTPPVLSVTDPVLIGKHSALNLLVVGVGKNHLKEAQHSKALFEKGGVQLSGVVFNHTMRQKTSQVYGYEKYQYVYQKSKV